MPCLALPCLALPCLLECAVSVSRNSTRDISVRWVRVLDWAAFPECRRYIYWIEVDYLIRVCWCLMTLVCIVQWKKKIAL